MNKYDKIIFWTKANWDKTLGVFLILGFIISYFFLSFYTEYFLFLLIIGVNAIFWLLIELKTHLITSTNKHVFSSLTNAENELLEKLKLELERPDKDKNIFIIGGRIRTIFSILKGLNYDIISNKINACDTTIHIFCLDPDYIKSWNFKTIKNEKNFSKKVTSYSEIIRSTSNLLLGFNEEQGNKSKNIKYNIIHYKSYPYFYAFLIGKSSIFWGFYTWDDIAEDFVGPSNSCYYLDSRMEEYKNTYNWLHNRAEFLSLSETAYTITDVNVEFLNQLGNSAELYIALKEVLEINKHTYNSVAIEYLTKEIANKNNIEMLISKFKKYLPPNGNTNVVDLGSGTGFTSKLLCEANYTVTGIDFSKEMNILSKSKEAEIKIIEGEFLDYDFGNEKFAGVVGLAFIHLFPSQFIPGFFEKLKSILQNEGIVLLSTTVHEKSEEGFSVKSNFNNKEIKRYRKKYTRDEFDKVIRDNNFTIIESFSNKDDLMENKVWYNVICKLSK